jgi:hypothetical protein
MIARPLALVLVGLVLLLRSLAYASPPDPDSPGGLYDNGDHDDVVSLITSSPSAPPAALARAAAPERTSVWILPTPLARLAPAPAPALQPSRAPPAV